MCCYCCCCCLRRICDWTADRRRRLEDIGGLGTTAAVVQLMLTARRTRMRDIGSPFIIRLPQFRGSTLRCAAAAAAAADVFLSVCVCVCVWCNGHGNLGDRERKKREEGEEEEEEEEERKRKKDDMYTRGGTTTKRSWLDWRGPRGKKRKASERPKEASSLRAPLDRNRSRCLHHNNSTKTRWWWNLETIVLLRLLFLPYSIQSCRPSRLLQKAKN